MGTTPTKSPTDSASATSAPKSGLSSGAAAAIGASIGGVVLIIALIVGFILLRRRKARQAGQVTELPANSGPPYQPVPPKELYQDEPVRELDVPTPELSGAPHRHVAELPGR